ncbi:MAG: hypothetical protein ACP5IL_17490 [Syntrophobacteraceae bacterium]
MKLIHVFLVSTMFSIGLAVSADRLAAVFFNPSQLLRVLLANIVIVPALGMVLVKVLPLSEDMKTAILLLALSPGGIQALQLTARTKDTIPFAAAVMFLLTIVGIVISLNP